MGLINKSVSLLLGFPCGAAGKDSACSGGDLRLIPGSGRSPGEGMAILSSILAWRIPWTEKPGRLQFVGVPKSQTQLSD